MPPKHCRLCQTLLCNCVESNRPLISVLLDGAKEESVILPQRGGAGLERRGFLGELTFAEEHELLALRFCAPAGSQPEGQHGPRPPELAVVTLHVPLPDS